MCNSERIEVKGMTTIKYKANPEKILEGVVWVCGKRPGQGFHYILKTLFYADKRHLSRYGRPVFGDTYVKMPFGPVASLAYDILKGSEYAPDEYLEMAADSFSVDRSGKYPRVTAKRTPNESLFSGTDLDCLAEAMELCDGMDFGTLTSATHEEKAWLEADMNSEMDYAKFIDEDVPDRDGLIAYISETACCLAL